MFQYLLPLESHNIRIPVVPIHAFTQLYIRRVYTYYHYLTTMRIDITYIRTLCKSVQRRYRNRNNQNGLSRNVMCV